MPWVFNDGGNTDIIDVASYPGINITGPLTICFWARWIGSQSTRVVAKWGADQAYLVEMTSADKPQMYIRVGEVNKSSGAPANSYLNAGWNHFAGIFDGANVRMKVNGGLTEDIVGDATSGPIDNPGSNPLRICEYNNVATTYFGGWLDEIAIFSRGLGNSEIRHLMREGCEDLAGLELYFKMDERRALKLRNLAPHGRGQEGTVAGTPRLDLRTPLPKMAPRSYFALPAFQLGRSTVTSIDFNAQLGRSQLGIIQLGNPGSAVEPVAPPTTPSGGGGMMLLGVG